MFYLRLKQQSWLAALGVFCMMVGLSLSANAQNLADPVKPIYVTTRIFQLSVPKGQNISFDEQVYRVNTANYQDDDKWITNLKKIYPNFSISLSNTFVNRVYRISKPATVRIGKQGINLLEIWLSGAQSPGDGTTPGTSMIVDLNINQGVNNMVKPVTYALQPLELESGKTYFFVSKALKLSGAEYTGWFRPLANPTAFANQDVYVVMAFSIELEEPKQTTRYFGERDSVGLQEGATKKVQPELSAEAKQVGPTGKVQVRVEIAPTGKVTKAITYNSTLPEMNAAVLAAARQWEFSPSLFAENQLPIAGFLTFEFPPRAPAPEKQQSSN